MCAEDVVLFPKNLGSPHCTDTGGLALKVPLNWAGGKPVFQKGQRQTSQGRSKRVITLTFLVSVSVLSTNPQLQI